MIDAESSALGNARLASPVQLERVALISDSSAGLYGLLIDTDWQRDNRINFVQVIEIAPSSRRERWRRLRPQTQRQAEINNTHPLLQLLSTFVYRLAYQPKPAANRGSARGQTHNTVVARSVNDHAVSTAIHAAAVDVVVVVSAGILSAQTIAEIALPIYNVHDADPRAMRGRPPFFWDIVDGRNEATITLHELEPSVDSGRIVHTEKIPIAWSTNLRTCLQQCERQAGPIRVRVVQQGLLALRDRPDSAVNVEPGTLRTLPTFEHIASANRRCRASHADRRQNTAPQGSLFSRAKKLVQRFRN